MKKVSVIVPVYQAEETIRTCLNSILKQEYGNIECIVVDDGSTDNSLCILYEMANIDSRIIVYHQDNKGVSSARNKGLELCTGEYITFVDADDVIREEFVGYMLDIAEKFSMSLVISNIGKNFSKFLKAKEGKIVSIDELIKDFDKFYSSYALNAVAGNLYRREQLLGIYFPLDIRIGEDLLFNLSYLRRIESLYIIDYRGYTYINNPNSATKKYRNDDFSNQKMQFENVLAYYREYSDNKEIPISLYEIYLKNLFFTYNALIYEKGVIKSYHVVQEYFNEPLLLEACKKVNPDSWQHKIAHNAVLKNSPLLLSLLGLIKSIKYGKRKR